MIDRRHRNRKVQSEPQNPETWNALKDFMGFVVLSFAVFVFACLISYDPLDPSFNTKVLTDSYVIANYGGIVGSHLADLMMQIFGYASFLFPLALVEVVRALVFRETAGASLFKVLGFVFLTIISTLVLSMVNDSGDLPRWGGLAGHVLRTQSQQYLGNTGSVILTLCFGFTSLALVFGLGVKDALLAFSKMSRLCAAAGWSFAKYSKDLAFKGAQTLRGRLEKEEKHIQTGLSEIESATEKVIPIRGLAKPKLTVIEKPKPKSEVPIVIPSQKTVAAATVLPERDLSADQDSKEKKQSNYKLPQTDLLTAPENQEITIDRDQLLEDASILERKLKDFGVEGKVVEVQPGPVVTMYEFEPASGVKVNQITRLDDDLTLALRAMSVRISLVPGKSVIGIEVANKNRQIVYLKDIIADPVFSQSASKLTFAFGKDISGNSFVGDLRKMPHLLVAGATGSGKSVAINSMILSVLYKSTPEDVRMILVDPKMLELSLYDGIPHLLLPVVTDPRKASAALRWAVQEMERRYRLMADLGVRNLEGYNTKVLKHMEEMSKASQPELMEGTKSPEHNGKLPYLMIVIDELADLMMVSSREVEDYIIRLAQMARASGIHLLLATQRPSVDVITGVIKANMPSRISFQVSSKIDSRTILDCNGAETLLGAGDMLYLPPGTSRILRVHGAFVSDQEVEKVTNFWKSQGDPEYNEEILNVGAAESDDVTVEGGGADEQLYLQALEAVRERGIASISYIQRRLRIGYNRAARLVERMDEEGLLTPGEVGKPREVITSKLPF